MKVPVSAVVITYNEEKNIERCLQSLARLTDDIVVVDSFSRDSTEEICRKYNVNFLRRKWEGYGPTKNLGNSYGRYDYILSLDADEELSGDLIEEIKSEFNNPRYDCYEVPRKSNFCGKWLKFGHWNPESHIRIFRKNKIYWDSSPVHEKLCLEKDTTIRKLKGAILHYTIYSLEQYDQKNDKYSTLAAERLFKDGKKPGFIKLYISPFYRFFHSYILKLGILDGYYGYVIAKETGRVTFQKYNKLKKLREEK